MADLIKMTKYSTHEITNRAEKWKEKNQKVGGGSRCSQR